MDGQCGARNDDGDDELTAGAAIYGGIVYVEAPARLTRAGAQNRPSAAATAGELRYGGARAPITGRALRLIAWLAARQERINQSAEESGQLWLTWKGDGPQSISGDIRTRL